ncbi:DUF721 domain-containing protein [Paraferrimonas sedimenticola]|uniref:DUF721 domain-containing protein n=1 Tax=Paraferrimonas sedimenticola TaxID=375674 RepID=A0AA37RZL5_9GAMM|nr:DciA family protein [Paraferrimonas sedimenticola]GLP97492.1 DUF721 domain-containing protein [Paraferrimonas sedimenticola]
MKKLKPKGLENVAKGNNRLHQLLHHAEHISTLDKQVKHFVGNPLSQHLQVMNLRDGVLVVAVESASWHTRLNFVKPALTDWLRTQSLPMLAAIEVKVNPQMAQITKKEPTHSNRISQTAATTICEAAESIGGSLGEKLKRLALKASR